MPHTLLKRYHSLYDLVYISSHLYESEAFRKVGYQDTTPPWSVMSKMYLTATDEDFIWRQGLSTANANSRTAERLLIVTPFMAAPNDPLLLLCIRNRKHSARSPWFAERFIPRSEFEQTGQFAGIPEGEWLRNWAVIRLGESCDYFGALEELAKLTHPDERWHYGLAEDKHYPILGNYLRYTFYKLWLDHSICYSADGQTAAFNTGLVSGKYEFIYAVFERIQPQNGKFWNLKGFCIAGEQGLGKEFLRQFNPLPRPAHFFSRTSELIYEIDYDLPLERQIPYVDYNHIIHDNLSRFPLSFLKSICFGYHDILALLEQVPQMDSKQNLEQLWKQIDRLLDDDLFLRIKTQIDRGLRITMRRVIWNYKTAIPVYFPVRNVLSWLLPLALNPGSRADIALVVERFPNGNLEGHTILDLDMAYTNARLISKPESDWLTPSTIEMGIETRLEIRNEQPDSAPPAWPDDKLQELQPKAEVKKPETKKQQKKTPTSVLEAKIEDKPKNKEKPKKESAISKIVSALDVLNRQRGILPEKSAKQEAVSQLSAIKKDHSPHTSKGKVKAAESLKSDNSAAVGKTKQHSKTKPVSQPKADTVSPTPEKNLMKQNSKAPSVPHTKQQTPTQHKDTENQPSRSKLGKEVVLEKVTLRKGHRGLQGTYQGVIVTVAPGEMPKPPETYLGTDFTVRLLRINPQGTQYIGRIPKNKEKRA